MQFIGHAVTFVLVHQNPLNMKSTFAPLHLCTYAIRHCLIALCFMYFSPYMQAQSFPDSNLVYVGQVMDSTISRSKKAIQLKSAATVRFVSNSSIFLNWVLDAPATNFKVFYKLSSQADFRSVLSSNNSMVINGLITDAVYDLRIETFPNDTNFSMVLGKFNTFPQKEPAEVSGNLYDKLANWFSANTPNLLFCDMINSLSNNYIEKLSFLQAYAYRNQKFNNPGPNLNVNRYVPNLDGDCLYNFRTQGCGCVVATVGRNFVAPGSYSTVPGGPQAIAPFSENLTVKGSSDKTYTHRLEAGVAHYASLHQSEPSGGMFYTMSNLPLPGDPNSDGLFTSSLRFQLGCSTAAGSPTNLPISCQCARPVEVEYAYSARTSVKAEARKCPWTRGAGAEVNEVALITSKTKNGPLTVINAQTAISAIKFNSSWNAAFWVNVVNLAGEVAKAYIKLQAASNGNISLTPADISIATGVINSLIITPYVNNSGNQGTIVTANQLISGTYNTSLTPNNPLAIDMFSGYYLHTQGFGCYSAHAKTASDYYLVGVVESELPDDRKSECCSDKFASYVAGSLGQLSTPNPFWAIPYKPDLSQSNTITSRLGQLGLFLSVFGSWKGLSTVPGAGFIALSREYDLLSGPSCIRPTVRILEGNRNYLLQESLKSVAITLNDFNEIKLSNLILPADSEVNLNIYNTMGQLIESIKLDAYSINHPVAVKNNVLTSGLYYAGITVNNITVTKPILKF